LARHRQTLDKSLQELGRAEVIFSADTRDDMAGAANSSAAKTAAATAAVDALFAQLGKM
jgi:hypothetical protein